MLKAILVYLITGEVLTLIYAIGVSIGLFLKYGLDISKKAVGNVYNMYVIRGRNWFEKVSNYVIGSIVWPIRLSDVPIQTERIHIEAELLMDSRKEKGDS